MAADFVSRPLRWFEPYNAAVVEHSFGLAHVQRIEGAVRTAAKTLDRDGIRVVDLSRAVPEHLFIDRWCACGHLGEAARMLVRDGLS